MIDILLGRLTSCVEAGKINRTSPHPPHLKGEDGTEELRRQAIELGINPGVILNEALIPGISRIGEKFSQGKAFVPDMLIAAKAMSAAMLQLKPFFISGEIKERGHWQSEL